MSAERSYLFMSYKRTDFDLVLPVVNAVREQLVSRRLPVDAWIDIANLRPGESWDYAVMEALERSMGFIVFLSPSYLHSDLAERELDFIAQQRDRLVVPVLLHKLGEVPHTYATQMLMRFQALDISGERTKEEIERAAIQIAEAVAFHLKRAPQFGSAVEEEGVSEVAAAIAEQLRAPIAEPSTQQQETTVFVVHGHNPGLLERLEQYLSSVGIEAVVLARRDELPQSLFQKFMSIATQARFVIVLLSADDYGASLRQYEAPNVAEKALQFRARQNVILELGFFYGRLGWENVFVVYHPPNQVYPNFERPSDLDGVIFQSTSDSEWETKLGAKLSAAGFRLLSVD